MAFSFPRFLKIRALPKKRLALLALAIMVLLLVVGIRITKANTSYTIVSIVVSPNTDPLDTLNVSALPEKRVGSNNLSTKLRTRVYDTTGTSLLLTDIANSSSAGLRSSIDFSSLSPDNYDVFVKGESHLTRKLNDFALYSLLGTINISPNSSRYLLAGDVNGVEFGDDIVNSIDLSIVINDLDAFDLRSDLNRDNIVNALDLSALLNNLDVSGES